jgi:hypothetical protein
MVMENGVVEVVREREDLAVVTGQERLPQSLSRPFPEERDEKG